MRRILSIAGVLSLILFVQLAAAAETFDVSAQEQNARKTKRAGIKLGFFDPYPSFVSANLAYNISDRIQTSIGAGTIFFIGSTIGAEGKYLINGEDRFSPTLGLGINRTVFTDFLSGAFGLAKSPDEILWSSTASAGIDWQAYSGFHFGLGLNGMWLASSNAVGTRIFPYLTLGWFF